MNEREGRAAMEGQKIIEVRGLDVRRSGGLAIKGADLDVYRGDYVGVVGPNGGGKTSLLLSLLGELPRERGTIELFGEPLESFQSWSRIAFVSQSAINFDPQFPLTVRELISLGLVSRDTLGRRLKPEDWDKVESMMTFMGIADLAARRIGRLSGGQKQRAFVAKALVRDPELLILDEPLSGVDADTQEKFYMKLANLNQERGTTIMVVSHDLTAVFCRMSRVVCVNRTVYESPVTRSMDPNELLRKAYGDHFHFVFHQHACGGEFNGV